MHLFTLMHYIHHDLLYFRTATNIFAPKTNFYFPKLPTHPPSLKMTCNHYVWPLGGGKVWKERWNEWGVRAHPFSVAQPHHIPSIAAITQRLIISHHLLLHAHIYLIQFYYLYLRKINNIVAVLVHIVLRRMRDTKSSSEIELLLTKLPDVYSLYQVRQLW